MSKIVFIEMPASGHVNPTLPIVRELVRRGEQVLYYDAEEFRAVIEATGAEFRPYPPGLGSADIAVATRSGDLMRVPALILEATETLLPWMADELARERPDAIALDSNALWGHMAAKRLALPTVSLMTTFMLGSSSYARLNWREWWHMLVPSLGSLPRVLGIRSRLLRRFGKDAFPKSPAFPARGDLSVAFVPPGFQAPNPLVDDTFRFVGPTVERRAGGEFPFERTAAGPIVYLSLGTLHLGSLDFFRDCFEAFGAMPAQFVLSVGAGTDVAALGPIPPNFIVRRSVPQLDVLRHADVFITHGGMNSALEALNEGVPLIVIPQQVEQLLIALHVEDAGAGLALREHVQGRRVSPTTLRRALERVLADPSFRDAAKKEQQAIHATGGYRQAADEIQAFIARRAERPTSEDPTP